MHVKTVVCLEAVVLQSCPDVLRCIGQRICYGRRNSTADPAAFNEIVAGIDRLGMGNEHMVVHLRTDLFLLMRIRLIQVHALIHAHHQVLLVMDLP